MNRSEWVWMPHPAHLIVGNSCRFHLATFVGHYVVSTVGEYLPPEGVREILAMSRGVTLEGKGDYREAEYLKKLGYEEIGYDRLYETMVFKAKKHGGCCPYRIESGQNVDFEGYNKPEDAMAGHMRLCKRWAKRGANYEQRSS